jgi:hypothetical protein
MSDNQNEAANGSPESQPLNPKAKGGRPRKARGAANSADDAGGRWTVRGVQKNVRDMALKMALQRGMTLGDWISEAIVRFARADQNTVSADVPGPTVVDTLKVLSERLTKLEEERSKGFLKRLFG